MRARWLALALVASPAGASEPGNVVCGLPQVLSRVADHLRAQTAHLELLDDTAIELQTDGERAYCSVTVRVRRYDASDPHVYPETLIERRFYNVRRLRYGLEVEYVP